MDAHNKPIPIQQPIRVRNNLRTKFLGPVTKIQYVAEIGKILLIDSRDYKLITSHLPDSLEIV